MAVSDFSHKQEAEDLKKTHEKENKKNPLFHWFQL